MNRKPSVMTGIPESIAVSAAVEKVPVSGTNSIAFWGRPHTFWLGYWLKKGGGDGGKAIRCLKNRRHVGCKYIKWNKNRKVLLLVL